MHFREKCNTRIKETKNSYFTHLNVGDIHNFSTTVAMCEAQGYTTSHMIIKKSSGSPGHSNLLQVSPTHACIQPGDNVKIKLYALL